MFLCADIPPKQSGEAVLKWHCWHYHQWCHCNGNEIKIIAKSAKCLTI